MGILFLPGGRKGRPCAVIANQCAHWCGNPFSFSVQRRRALPQSAGDQRSPLRHGTSVGARRTAVPAAPTIGRRNPHRAAEQCSALRARTRIRRATKGRPYAVIANQCAHWCGNPFSLSVQRRRAFPYSAGDQRSPLRHGTSVGARRTAVPVAPTIGRRNPRRTAEQCSALRGADAYSADYGRGPRFSALIPNSELRIPHPSAFSAASAGPCPPGRSPRRAPGGRGRSG